MISIPHAYSQARELHRVGRWAEAEVIYRQILAADPNHADTLHLLGVLAAQHGHMQASADLISRAIAIKGSDVEYHNNLGSALAGLQKLPEAAEQFRAALGLNPNYVEAMNNLANVCTDMGLFDEAIAAGKKAIELEPNQAVGHYTLGNAYRAMEDWEPAIACYERSIQIKPDFLEVLNNLANAYYNVQRIDDALQCWERGFQIQPNFPLGHWNAGFCFLIKGDYERGLEEYEWRLRVHHPKGDAPENTWNGEPLNGKRILLATEQGMGDSINFARYIPMVAERGGKVIVVVHPPLGPLLRHVEGVIEIVPHGDQTVQYHVRCQLPSLPRIFKTRIDSIPNKVPYIRARPEKIEKWKKKIAEDLRGRNDVKLKVGLAWAGQPFPPGRFIPPQLLLPLATVAGVRFYSLQKSEGAVQTGNPAGMELVDWTNEINDFADTAGLIENLDLVITIDTAAAHLAGAMGKPAWVMLKYVPYWLWMLDRGDSLWYPTVKLFRQKKSKDWEAVIENVRSALANEASPK